MTGRRDAGSATTWWLIAGGCLIAIGIGRGELAAVLARAIRVCLQCIGIG